MYLNLRRVVTTVGESLLTWREARPIVAAVICHGRYSQEISRWKLNLQPQLRKIGPREGHT
jgi:hypothetical protein